MLNIEPDEVGGLQDKVSNLKSDTIKHTLTKSVSFDFFCPEVRIDRLDKLYKLCLLLDYYLVKEPSGKYALEFNLEKFKKRECYVMLNEIRQYCLYDVRNEWYYSFLMRNTNLADSEDQVKDGLRLR